MPDSPTALGFGISGVLLGGTGLGLTIWRHTERRRLRFLNSVSIAPMVAPQRDGSVTVGVSLKLVTF